jgi:four helix bundle protein
MSSLRRFEEIEAWQVGRALTRRVYECSGVGRFAKDLALQRQIRRATVSIVSNIAEGFERGGSAEFVQFLAVAKGSTAEVQSQLYVALDAGYISTAEFDELQQLAVSVKRLLAGFMNYLKRSPLKGQKFATESSNNRSRQPRRERRRATQPETTDQRPGTNK